MARRRKRKNKQYNLSLLKKCIRKTSELGLLKKQEIVALRKWLESLETEESINNKNIPSSCILFNGKKRKIVDNERLTEEEIDELLEVIKKKMESQ